MSWRNKRYQAWAVFGIQCAIAAGFVYWMFRLGYGPNADPDYFQRLGSAMVAAGVANLTILGPRLNVWIIADMSTDLVDPGEYRGLSLSVAILEWGLIILGTLIWGYGDLLVCSFNDLKNCLCADAC